MHIHKYLVLTALICFVCMCTACTKPESRDLPTDAITQIETMAEKRRCGDGICDGPETAANCAEDCEDIFAQNSIITIQHWVENPTSGARLYIEILLPSDSKGQKFPTIILVPGGSGDSQDFTSRPVRTHSLLEAGYALVVFDPDGRGKSEGVEDNNGTIHQDGLAAIIAYAANLPMIDAEQMGMVTYSYGITMGSGALARHPDLPIRFLLDWEGPATRDDTGGCDEDNLGHLTDQDCADEGFWAEREAATFVKFIQVPYMRLQSQQDHVQPDNQHAILMINNATAPEYGGSGRSPWTRLNDLPENMVYSFEDPPQMLDDRFDNNSQQLILSAIQELFLLQIN